MRGELKIKKEDLKNLSKIIVFIAVTSLPFITITNTVGMDTFLDSFENPESYLCLKNEEGITATEITNPSYIIIQRNNHPDFEINVDDEVMYSTLNGEIICNKVEDIQKIGDFEKIKTQENSNIIYKNQIIGKVIKIVDENPWNTISLKVWSISIENLNINTLFK